MKKLSLILVFAVLFAFLTACSANNEYANFEEHEDGAVLKHGDIIYTFFGALSNDSLRGEQLGIIGGDETHKVYAVNGYPSDEWVIEYMDVIMSVYSLYKADTVTEIPDALRP